MALGVVHGRLIKFESSSFPCGSASGSFSDGLESLMTGKILGKANVPDALFQLETLTQEQRRFIS